MEKDVQMKKKNFILLIQALFIFFVSHFTFATEIDFNPLPIWIDHSREVSDQLPPLIKRSVFPDETFRLPAEYEPVQAIFLGNRGYSTMLKDIAEVAANEGHVEIWMANGPSSLSNVPSELYKPIHCPLNTVWARDYGPFGIADNGSTLAIVDSIYRHYSYRRYDDALPTCLANQKKVSPFGLNVILDGGNVMVDSTGNLFMTKRTYNWNSNKSPQEVDQLIKAFFNVHTIHTFDYAGYPGSPGDGTGHIDMFVKLLNDNTVLITETNDEPFRTACEKAFDYFQSQLAPNGKPYKIYRIPGWRSGRTWYTYTNSLIVNDIVIVPSYSNSTQLNEQAQTIYQNASPNLKVKFVNSDSSISAGGSIHCVTQQIPALTTQ